MNRSDFKEVINASLEKTWEILFKQYGDIHNPYMVSSHYVDDSTQGELNSIRHTQFNEKLYLHEQITEVEELKSFTVSVTKHNLPFVKDMSAKYELVDLGEGKTEVNMTSYNSFSPKFMKYLMSGQLKKPIYKNLFGMKYYIETGKTVDMKIYSQVYKEYYAK